VLPFFVNSLSVNSQLILPCLTNREPDIVCVFFPSENNTSLPFEDSTYFFVFELTLSSVIVLEKLCEEEELKEEELDSAWLDDSPKSNPVIQSSIATFFIYSNPYGV